MNHPGAPQAAWPRLQPWLSLLVRLGLAVVAGLAAWPKLEDLAASQRSVAAYELFPEAIWKLVGIGLPVVELALAVLFAAGLLTRYASALFGVMLVLFAVGIASAWARGLNIDCGCFSPGGALTAGEQAKYGWEILRDVGFMAMAAFLVWQPWSRLSLDTVLGLNPAPRLDKTRKTKD